MPTEAERARESRPEERGDADAASSGVESMDEGEPETPVICWACQRPIEALADVTLNGEPVHAACLAEARCGVSFAEWADD